MSGNNVESLPQEQVRPRKAGDPEAKNEIQKRALQKVVLALLDDGARVGLQPQSVRALREGLETLGWLPEVKP